MSASASDSDGSIARVEFWVDGTKISQDTTAPYQQNWTSTAGGHAVKARAVDDDGAIKDSTTHAIIVTDPNMAPTVSLTALQTGMTTSPAPS